MSPLLDFGDQPIAHRFLTEPGQVEYTHSFKVVYCPSCGLVQIPDPIPSEQLYTKYNWLSSWKPNPHIPRLVELISGLTRLNRQSKIIEAGCNDGSFLKALAGKGFTNVLGIEPAGDAEAVARSEGLRTVRDYFGPAVARRLVDEGASFDLFIARQVLEHVDDLDSFAEAIGLILRPGGYVLLEVPNAEFMLDWLDYSAFWEEHVNYFDLAAIQLFLARMGIRVLQAERIPFCGEALVVLGERCEPGPKVEIKNRSDWLERVVRLRDSWSSFRAGMTGFAQFNRFGGSRMAIYGAGARACSLVNFCGVGPLLECCFDDQPEKQGKYLPGSRIPIIPGDQLDTSAIGSCLLAVNAENEEQVIARHAGYIARGGQFASVNPPSSHLAPFWRTLLSCSGGTQIRGTAE